jgi:RNA recognition motif-containing protein
MEEVAQRDAMSKRIYVTNLPDFVDEDVLHRIFSQLGTVHTLRLVREKSTGRSKGTCFAELSTRKEARNAVASLNGVNFCDHVILEAGDAEPRLCLTNAQSEKRPQPTRARNGSP